MCHIIDFGSAIGLYIVTQLRQPATSALGISCTRASWQIGKSVAALCESLDATEARQMPGPGLLPCHIPDSLSSPLVATG